jgi:hypothetical protein
VQHKPDAHCRKRQAFVDDIRRAVAELHYKGIYPTPRLVLATLPEPQFRSRDIVAGAISLARRELSMEPYVVDRGRA